MTLLITLHTDDLYALNVGLGAVLSADGGDPNLTEHERRVLRHVEELTDAELSRVRQGARDPDASGGIDTGESTLEARRATVAKIVTRGELVARLMREAAVEAERLREVIERATAADAGVGVAMPLATNSLRRASRRLMMDARNLEGAAFGIDEPDAARSYRLGYLTADEYLERVD
jgi:hypothetical protein